MQITRRGFFRDHGPTTVLPDTPLNDPLAYWSAGWSDDRREVVIRSQQVRAPGSQTTHQYTIRLTLDDVAALIEMLGRAASLDNAAALRDSLGDRLPAIIRLLACASGLVPTPIPAPDETAIEAD